jgi:ABC-type uncharacterized transport system permease subunit
MKPGGNDTTNGWLLAAFVFLAFVPLPDWVAVPALLVSMALAGYTLSRLVRSRS